MHFRRQTKRCDAHTRLSLSDALQERVRVARVAKRAFVCLQILLFVILSFIDKKLVILVFDDFRLVSFRRFHSLI